MTTTTPPTVTFRHIPLGDITPDAENRPADLDIGFVRSIETQGILVPVTVRPADNDGRYALVAGHRRYAAAAQLGLATVPAIERSDLDDDAAMVIAQTVENIHRRDLTPIDEARQCARAVGAGMTRKALAAALGRPSTWVRDRLKLLELPDPAQRAVERGDVALSDAHHLVALADHPDVLQQVVDDPHPDIEWGVRRALKEIEAEQAVAKRRTALVDAGVCVVDDGYTECRQAGWKPVADLGLGEKSHAAEPCHRVTVGTGWEGVHETAWCAEPRRHTRSGESKLVKRGFTDEDLARKAERREQNRLQKRAEDARHEWLAERISSCAQRDALDLICRALIDTASSEAAKRACRWLGAGPKDPKAYNAWNGALDAAARDADSMTALVRVALAVAVAQPDWPDGQQRVDDWMAAAGWVPPDLDEPDAA